MDLKSFVDQLVAQIIVKKEGENALEVFKNIDDIKLSFEFIEKYVNDYIEEEDND